MKKKIIIGIVALVVVGCICLVVSLGGSEDEPLEVSSTTEEGIEEVEVVVELDADIEENQEIEAVVELDADTEEADESDEDSENVVVVTPDEPYISTEVSGVESNDTVVSVPESSSSTITSNDSTATSSDSSSTTESTVIPSDDGEISADSTETSDSSDINGGTSGSTPSSGGVIWVTYEDGSKAVFDATGFDGSGFDGATITYDENGNIYVDFRTS